MVENSEGCERYLEGRIGDVGIREKRESSTELKFLLRGLKAGISWASQARHGGSRLVFCLGLPSPDDRHHQ